MRILRGPQAAGRLSGRSADRRAAPPRSRRLGSDWVFPSTAGTPQDHANVNKAFKRVLKTADLPLHFTPHGLRHTYASLLLQQGASLAYVQRQLGHASIQLTVDT